MDDQSPTQGYGCSVFVGSDHVYGAYGSVAFDMESMRFVNGVRPERFVLKEVVCDYCIYKAVQRNIIEDFMESDSERASYDQSSTSIDRLKVRIERLIRDQIVFELRQQYRAKGEPFVSFFKSLRIVHLQHDFISLFFQSEDGALFHYYTDSGGDKPTCLTWTRRNAQCAEPILALLNEYPFWKHFNDIRMRLDEC